METYQEALMSEEIEELQGEVERLKRVKATVDFFKENKYAARRVKKTEIEKKVYPLEKMSKTELAETQQAAMRMTEQPMKEVGQTKAALSIVMMVVSGLIALCCLGNWYEIGGYEVNFFKLILGMNDDYGIGSLLMRRSGGFIELGLWVLVLCAVLCIGAFLFVIICYNFYKNQAQKDIYYVGMVYIVVLFVAIFCISKFFNSEVQDFFGVRFPVSLELTSTAWFTLILTVILFVLFRRQGKIGPENFSKRIAVLTGTDRDPILKGEKESLPVTVFYPWENLCFHTLSVRYGSYVSIALEYSYKGLLKDEISEEKKNQKVEVRADIVLETEDDMYVINDEIFMIERLKESGETESLPFSVSEFPSEAILKLEVYLKTIKSGSQEERRIVPLCIDSAMECEELTRYRAQENDDEAMCKYEEFGDEDGYLNAEGIFCFYENA